MRDPLIEIYGESHDCSYTNENYKILHARSVWNIFLQILANILIIILCCFISERDIHRAYQPHYFCFTGEGSTTAVNITDIIYFLLYICSFLRVNDKRKRFSFVLPLFLIKRLLPCREGWELEKKAFLQWSSNRRYILQNRSSRYVFPFCYSWAFNKNFM